MDKKILKKGIGLAAAALFLSVAMIVFSSLKKTDTPKTEEGKDERSEVAFIINTHDWMHPENSAATIRQIVELHDKMNIPVDIYLDDQIIQKYEEVDPEIFSLLKETPEVSVSYHLRPPYPYYVGFDWMNLKEKSSDEIRTTIENYETHAIDLATGQPTEEAGGYAHLKELMGYAPPVIAGVAAPFQKIANEVYADMGARMTLVHGKETNIGAFQFNLALRPENVEVKVYEKKDETPFADILKSALNKTSSNKYINLKWHEDNFSWSGNLFDPVYYGNKDRSEILTPPYAINGQGGSTERTQAQKDEQWRRYEEALTYMKERNNEYRLINARDLITELDAYCASADDICPGR